MGNYNTVVILASIFVLVVGYFPFDSYAQKEICTNEPAFMGYVVSINGQILYSEYFGDPCQKIPMTDIVELISERNINYHPTVELDIHFDDISNKISNIDAKLDEIQPYVNNFNIENTGKLILYFKTIYKNFLDLYDESLENIATDQSMRQKLVDVEKKHYDLFSHTSIIVYQHMKSSGVSMQQKNLIHELLQNNMDFVNKKEMIYAKQQTSDITNNEIFPTAYQNEFVNNSDQILVDPQEEYGHYDNDKMLFSLLKESIENESWFQVKLVMNILEERYQSHKFENNMFETDHPSIADSDSDIWVQAGILRTQINSILNQNH